MRVMANKGCVCPMEDGRGQITDAASVDVPETSYYRRRIADGSLIYAVHAEPAKPKQAAADASAAKKAEVKNDK